MYAPNFYSIITRGEGMTLRCPVQPGYVYLIHFKEPYRHACHYLGSAMNLEARLELHRTGRGARLMEVVNEAGISWHVSKIWQCDTSEEARVLEARLKRWNNDKRLCPVCMGKPADPLAARLYGHPAFHLYETPGRRQPMTTRPVYYLH